MTKNAVWIGALLLAGLGAVYYFTKKKEDEDVEEVIKYDGWEIKIRK